MAQRSLPQAGTGVGDSGPYSSDEWAEYFQITYTGDQEATQGPLRRYLNELVVSKAGLTITTGTGAGFVYGHFLVNDPALDIAVALAAAGLERYDRVVMVENNTNVVYNTNLALPAAYAAGIPRNSARIAILQGTEAGAAVLPALLTGPNYYMVELARYLVTDAVVGAIDDRREFCEFSHELPNRTRQLWVPALIGYNNTDLADIILSTGFATRGPAITFPDDKQSIAFGRFIVPADYVSDMTSTGVLTTKTSGGGNIYAINMADAGACSEGQGTHGFSSGLAAEAIAGTLYYYTCHRTLALTGIDTNDIIKLAFRRNGADVLDTIGENIDFLGWIIEYTADG